MYGEGNQTCKLRGAQYKSKRYIRMMVYELKNKLELQNIKLGIISREMTFKAIVMDDIIKMESIDREETGLQTDSRHSNIYMLERGPSISWK